ncbi:hypothetical protein D9M68_942300 [compost metagenome]
MQKIDDASERGDLRVIPQAQIAVADAAFGDDGCRLKDHQTKAANAKAPEMDEVPVIGETVLRGILAHGRDHGAIGEG